MFQYNYYTVIHVCHISAKGRRLERPDSDELPGWKCLKPTFHLLLEGIATWNGACLGANLAGPRRAIQGLNP